MERVMADMDPWQLTGAGMAGSAALTVAIIKIREMLRGDDVGAKVSGETKNLIDSLKGERDVAIKERDEAVERADNLQNKLDEERGKNSDLKAQVSKLTSDVEHIQQRLENVLKEFVDIRELYQKVSDALLESRIENAKLDGQIKALEREIGRRAFPGEDQKDQ